MNDLLKQLISNLESDFNPDYWADVIRPEAGAQLDTLQEDDWSHLLTIALSASVMWCIHLIEASLLSEKPRVISLLIAMLKRPEVEIGTAIADTLLEKNYHWSPEESLTAELLRHLGQASDSQAKPLRRLLGRLPS